MDYDPLTFRRRRISGHLARCPAGTGPRLAGAKNWIMDFIIKQAWRELSETLLENLNWAADLEDIFN